VNRSKRFIWRADDEVLEIGWRWTRGTNDELVKGRCGANADDKGADTARKTANELVKNFIVL
jgi:hypothetical protein